ncbi:MAG: hypothetical protein QOG53_2600 [Frankiales bacterium]|nr:hypothetical protein [Frankiales bacterium]
MTGFDPAALLDAAETETGLDQWGDASFHEGLEIYCAALDAEAQLSELGDLALQGNLHNQLTNRLKVIDHARRHEVAGEVITQPVFVIGLFRAGTTLLSNLLDQDPANRSLLHWEAGDTAPPATPETFRQGERVEAVRGNLEMLHLLNPQLSAIHREDADAPTECIALMAQDFKALLWESIANVPTYGQWLMKTDQQSAYRHHKLCLQVLQSGGVRGQWSLKSPHHALALDALTAVYPDARLVYLHRDPVEVATSAFSLIRCLSGTFSDADHTAYIVDRWTDVLVESVQRVDSFRDANPATPIHDMRYADLRADPVAAVRGLYAFLDRELTVADALSDYLSRNPQGKHGAHRYSVEDFGVDAASIRERFQPYLDRYSVMSQN